MKRVYLAGIGIAVVVIAAMYINMLRDDLDTARDKVTQLSQTVFELEANIERAQEASLKAEQESIQAEKTKGEAKEDVRVIIKKVDCSNQQLPVDAIKRMREYRDTIRSSVNTN